MFIGTVPCTVGSNVLMRADFWHATAYTGSIAVKYFELFIQCVEYGRIWVNGQLQRRFDTYVESIGSVHLVVWLYSMGKR